MNRRHFFSWVGAAAAAAVVKVDVSAAPLAPGDVVQIPAAYKINPAPPTSGIEELTQKVAKRLSASLPAWEPPHRWLGDGRQGYREGDITSPMDNRTPRRCIEQVFGAMRVPTTRAVLDEDIDLMFVDRMANDLIAARAIGCAQLPLPSGVFDACHVRHGNVLVRGVVDYTILTDDFTVRFDVLGVR